MLPLRLNVTTSCSVICPLIVALITVPAAVVAVISSSILNVVIDLFVRTNSMMGIAPNFREVILETSAVAADERPVIVRPI